MQKVSIIIPIYNAALYVEKSLLSALNQTYRNIEYILVDDCGNDDSMSIVEAIANNYPNKDIKIVRHPQNMGASAARNTGLKNSTGEYVFFMDSDDTISDNCIELHLNAIQQHDADFSDANFQIIGSRNIFNITKSAYYLHESDILIGCFNGQIHISPGNKLYKRSFIMSNNLRFVEGILIEDTIWMFDIAKYAKCAVMIPDYTYHYCVRSGSVMTCVSTNSIIKRYDSWVHVLNHVISIAQNTDNQKLLSSISAWLSSIRFKISARLVVVDIDEDIKRKYYKLINSKDVCRFSSGPFALFCSLPYGLFKLIFKPLYNIFTYINSLKS